MTGFLLDTHVPSELTRPQSDPQVEQWLDDAGDGRLFLSVVSLGEIFKGITMFDGRILPITEGIGERWGILAGEWQLKGRGITVADRLIAATALEHDLTVVTRNQKDFAELGVTVFNPWCAR